MRKATSYIFADATERDTFTGFGTGVQALDTCILGDGSRWYYDASQEVWRPSGDIAVATADATPLNTTIGTLDTDSNTAQLDVWIQSVMDTGTNWRFRRATLTAFRIAGVVTIAPAVDLLVPTFAGSGITVGYAFSVLGDAIRCDITGNLGENWSHTIRVIQAGAGA